jgi:quinoprotein glucose dehydrogenase
LQRRIINANFRLGGRDEAEALVQFAQADSAEEPIRAEALRHLGDWAAPSGRDAVTGLWRPMRPRNPAPAATAIRNHLSRLLNQGAAVQIAAIQAAQKLGVTEAGPDFQLLVANAEAGTRVRIAALQALAGLKDPHLPLAIHTAQLDAAGSLRSEANRLLAKSNPEEAVPQLQIALRSGSLGEKQAALETLAVIPGPATDAILSGWMDQLLAGKVEAPLRLDVLEAAGQREAAGIQSQLQVYESRRRADDPMRSYRESLEGGNAGEGRRIFFERLDVYCSRCHKVDGEGGDAGPDLTGIGSRQTREYILESILLPNQRIAEGFETIAVTLNNGDAFAGLLLRETDTILELNSLEDGSTSIKKADIKSRGTGLSGMPEELRQVLSRQDARNLVEYLSQLP